MCRAVIIEGMRHLICLLLSIGIGAGICAAPPLPQQPPDIAWPTEEWPTRPLPATVDTDRLANALAGIFETVPEGRQHPDIRAVLVIQHGQIVLETYAPGFGPESRFLSWSLAKGVTNALTGILVRDGVLTLDQGAPVAEWQGDDRKTITIRHLLNMTSGIDNHDAARTSMLGFVSDMLFGPDFRFDVYAAAVNRPKVHEPGTHWAYSTGSSNILAGVIGRAVGNSKADTLAFMQRELFQPLGMRQTQPEFDRAGNFVGGTFVWAPARDWARFGYLYLRDGHWAGTQILPPGWVDFSRTLAKVSNNLTHTAHMWVSAIGNERQVSMDPALNAFYMSGARGQMIAVVPDRDLVVVRLGEAHASRWPDIVAFVEQLVTAFPRLDR